MGTSCRGFILKCCVDMYQVFLIKTANTFGRDGLFIVTGYISILNMKRLQLAEPLFGVSKCRCVVDLSWPDMSWICRVFSMFVEI